MLHLLAVGIGGFAGSCLRYGLTRWLGGFAILPIGTLASNVLAGLLIGFIIGVERQTALMPENIKLFLTVGLLGGLSTFSAFSMETVSLFERGNYFHAVGNILLNVCLSLAFVLAGLQLAKLLVRT
ncbi:MAG: fluoride efflux transporter CrcB [Dehalococcoidia bacterium]|nr:fluoride efflux transporter CrcB [Dehalococcoidia bacterium]